jgi:hypothetical protein
MSVAFGVSYDIRHRLNVPFFRVSPAAVSESIALIDTIFTLFTAVVAAAMFTETAAATFTVGVVLMCSRKAEIAITRQRPPLTTECTTRRKRQSTSPS